MPRPTPEHPRPPQVLPALTADTLVLADFRPRGRDRPPGPYRRLLALPGARAFTAGSLLARLPMGMFGVSAVLMIAARYGSYALAGAVTATGLAVTALVAPWVARLVDRHGQARVAVPAALLAALGSLALVLCVRAGSPAWTLFAAHAATATAPNTGGMARARWSRLVGRDAAALHSAHALEQAADELCFMLGPVLAAFLCTAWFPEAGTAAGVVLLVTGTLLFAAQRATEPPPVRHTSARAPLRSPGMPALLALCVAMGAVFGATEVVTVAFADAQGHRAAAGVALGFQAAGSCAAGLAYGALRLPGSAALRLPWCVAAMAVLMTLPFLAATSGSVLLVSAALFVAGTATAPTMVTTMTLVQRRAPEGRLNESMTLAVTGLLTGIALGSAAGGWTADHTPPATGYALPATAATLALLAAPAGARRRKRDGQMSVITR